MLLIELIMGLFWFEKDKNLQKCHIKVNAENKMERDDKRNQTC